ncbi:hypothetical protein E6H29_07510 [Candidatus Bathyarchaeota archaeon]|nr:MAG: hypothetical protein E6H29_07510 [Candidatus Bathyarchaeota archaeon]
MTDQARSSPVGFFHFPGLGHFLVVLIVTNLEIVGLMGWLAVATGKGLDSVFGNLAILSSLNQLDQFISTIGRARFASIFLGFFLLMEHIIAQMDQTGRGISGREFTEILSFTSLEAVIWTVWLLLIPVNGVLAIVFFLGSLFVEHQITDNVKKGLPFLHFARLDGKLFRGLVLFTIFEVMGAVVWVAQGRLIALALGSTLEHYVARNVGQITEKDELRSSTQ